MDQRMSFFVKDWQMRYPKWRRMHNKNDHGHSAVFSIDVEKRGSVKESFENSESRIEFWDDHTSNHKKGAADKSLG